MATMLGNGPRAVLTLMGRPFTFVRGATQVQVTAFLRGTRSSDLVNSEVQADAQMTVDAVPLAAAGVAYLQKFDKFVSAFGEAYSVEESHVSFDGTTPVFHKCFVRGTT